MNSLSFKIALSYARASYKEKNVSLMMKVCLMGISIGSFALMLSLIIMNGFEKEVHDKIQGINADITLSYPSKKLNPDSFKKQIQSKFENEFIGISASSTQNALVENDGERTILFIKSINPADEESTTNLKSKIVESLYEGQTSLSLSELMGSESVLIGHKLARDLGVFPGGEITLLIPDGAGKKSISFSKTPATVSGIFKIGMDEYDTNFVYMREDFFNKIFEQNGADEIALRLKKTPTYFWQGDRTTHMVKRLEEAFPGFSIRTWKDLYPELVSSLLLEKYAVFLIIALITLVASMNMISLLFIQIQSKRRDIAIFKTLGMPESSIQNIFLNIGLIITLLGSLIGLGLAGLAGYILETYPLIKLPDVYYVSHLPARMQPGLFILVFAITMVIGFFATWLPARRTRNLNITSVLRSE